MAKFRWIKLAHLMPHVIWYCKFKETKPRKLNTCTSYRDLASRRASNSSSSSSSSPSSASPGSASSAKGKAHIKLPSYGSSHQMKKKKKSHICKGNPVNSYKDKSNMINSTSSCNGSPWRKSNPHQGSIKEEAAFVDLYSDSHLQDNRDPCAALDAYSPNEIILDLQELQSKLKNLSNHIGNGNKRSLDYCNHKNYDDDDDDEYHHEYSLLMPSSPILNEDYDSPSFASKNTACNTNMEIKDDHITMKKSLNDTLYRNCSSLVSSPCHSPRCLKRQQSSSSSITNPTKHNTIHHSNDMISTNPNASSHSCVIVKDSMPHDLLHTTNYTRFKQQQLIDKAPWKALNVSEKHYDLSAQQMTSENSPNSASTTTSTRSGRHTNRMGTYIRPTYKHHEYVASSMCSRDVHPDSSTMATHNFPTKCMRGMNRGHHDQTVRSFDKKKKLVVKVAPSPWPCGGNELFHATTTRSHEPMRKSCDDGCYVYAWCQEGDDHPWCTQSIHSDKVSGQANAGHRRVRKGRAVGNRGRDNYLKHKVHVGRARSRLAAKNGSGHGEPWGIVTGKYEQLLLEQQRHEQLQLLEQQKQLKLEQPNQLLKQQDLPQQEELEELEEESDLLLKAANLYRSVAMVKCSKDPHNDFKESMMEMIEAGRGAIIKESSDLVELLRCYLSLNSRHYHDTIVDVFVDLWSHHLHLSPR